ncbi:hypothetical protein Tco_0849215 [Tanacetum coccineum]
MESLETDLKKTKLTYGAAYTKLIKKVKKLENKVKSNQARRRTRIVVSDDGEDLEDPSKQERNISKIDQDPIISLDVSTAEEDISTAKPISSTGVVVTTASVDVSTATVSTAKYKGKGIMEESKPDRPRQSCSTNKKDLVMKQLLDYKLNLRKKRGRGLPVVEADEELAHRLQAEEREKYSEAEKARLLAELINERKSEKERAIPESTAGSSKRDAEEELA